MTLTAPTPEYADADYIKENFHQHYYFDQRGAHVWLTALEKLRHLVPWQITGHYAKDLQEKPNRLVEENKYDLIFLFK